MILSTLNHHLLPQDKDIIEPECEEGKEEKEGKHQPANCLLSSLVVVMIVKNGKVIVVVQPLERLVNSINRKHIPSQHLNRIIMVTMMMATIVMLTLDNGLQ